MRPPTAAIAFLVLPMLLAAPALAGEHVRVPGTNVELVPPEGFEPADGFAGFLHRETGCHIMVSTLPTSAATLAPSMTDEKFASAGVRVLSREQAEGAAGKGWLLLLAQTQEGIDFRKWLFVVDLAGEATLVNGIFPEEGAAEWSDLLRAAVLTARASGGGARDPFEGLPFTLGVVKGVKFARQLQMAALFTRDGVVPAKEPGDPFLIVTGAVKPVTVPPQSRKATAEAQLRRMPFAELTVESNVAVTVDDLPGFEIVAHARDADSGLPLLVYQLILFTENSWFRVLATVAREGSEGMLANFRESARSFRRR